MSPVNFRVGSRRGFGLTELIVAMGLLGILIAGFSAFMTSQHTAIKANRTVANRDGLLMSLQRLAGDATALTLSANDTRNPALKKCVQGCTPTGPTCCSISSASPAEFTLLDQSSNPVAGTTAPAYAVYYDIDGARCTTPSSQCALRAVAIVSATCAGGASSCAQAQSIQVGVRLEQNPGITLSSGTPLKPRTTAVITSAIPLTNSLKGSGTPNYLAKFLNADLIGDSTVFEDTDKIGIGVTDPRQNLSVNKFISVDHSESDTGAGTTIGTYHGISFGKTSGESIGSTRVAGGPNRFGLTLYTGWEPRIDIQQTSGFVGVGTRNPLGRLHVNGELIVSGARTQNVPAGAATIDFDTSNNSLRFNTNGSDIAFNTAANGTSEKMRISANPNSPIVSVTGNRAIAGYATNPDLSQSWAVYGYNSVTGAHGYLGYGNNGVWCNGNCAGTSAWASSSDARLKKNVRTIDSALEKVNMLRGVTFEWKDSKTAQKSGTQLGLIAQEVEGIFPQAVQVQKGEGELKNGTKMIAYTALIAPLIEAVKELNQKVNRLSRENEELRKKIEHQETRQGSDP